MVYLNVNNMQGNITGRILVIHLFSSCDKIAFNLLTANKVISSYQSCSVTLGVLEIREGVRTQHHVSQDVFVEN